MVHMSLACAVYTAINPWSSCKPLLLCIVNYELDSFTPLPKNIKDLLMPGRASLMRELIARVPPVCKPLFPPSYTRSEKLLLSPRCTTRKISKTPFKVLDAPELQDDFYLNLLDWSAQNTLCVGLGTAIYLWSAHTCQVCGEDANAAFCHGLTHPRV